MAIKKWLPGFMIFTIAGFLCLPVSGQTTGAGYVSSIESKAKQILSIREDIDKLKNRIVQLQQAKQADINRARKNLQDAIDKVNTDKTWQTRLRTAQNGWEEYSPGTCSAGGPPPDCPVDHWFRTTVEQSMKRYNEYKDKYLKPFRDAINKAGIQQDNDIEKAKDDIQKKEDQIPELRRQIVALSQQYENHIKEAGDKRAESYASELVRILSEAHYQEGMISRYQDLIAENRSLEIEKKAEASEKVASEIEQLVQKIKSDIEGLEASFKRQEEALEEQIKQIERETADLQKRIRDEDAALYSYKGSGSGRLTIEERLKELRSQVYANNSRISALEQQQKDLSHRLFREKDLLNKRIFDARHDLTKMKQQAEKIVGQAFQAKKELLESSRENAVQLHGVRLATYKTKHSELDKEYQMWVNKVDTERRRMLLACQSVSAGCYGGNVVGDLNLAWNKAKGCLGDIDRVRNSDRPIFGCTNLLSYYHQLTEGKSTGSSAQNELKNQSYKNRLDNLYNKN